MAKSKTPKSPAARSVPFDPLAVENVGVTLAVELLEQELHSMPPAAPFSGAGVYALYYAGDHSAYKVLAKLGSERFKYPIYIGKAASQNAKQGFSPKSGAGRNLYDRIKGHAESIQATTGLRIEDFRCRFIILNDAYISLAESVMIRVFRPPWNGMSFGSKVVGKNRMSGKPPLWDSLHPGRGGRPSGSDERAAEAAALIENRINDLKQEISDPVIRRMHERIKKFI